MTHNTNYGSPGRDWMRRAAQMEDRHDAVTVGGLASDLGMLGGTDSATPRVLGRLVEWQRLSLNMSEEALAAKAQISIAEVRAIEHDEKSVFSTRVIFKIAEALKLSPQRLAVLAGLAEARDDADLAQASVRFAAKSATAELSKAQRQALEEFVRVLTSNPATKRK